MVHFCEFCTRFATINSWKKLGWKELPRIDGRASRNFYDLCKTIKAEDYYVVHESGDWFKHAVEIENQEVIRLNKRFERELLHCKDLKQLEVYWNVRGNGRKKTGNIRLIESKFSEITPSCAVSFHVDHLYVHGQYQTA